jgi:hypothetical protein
VGSREPDHLRNWNVPRQRFVVAAPPKGSVRRDVATVWGLSASTRGEKNLTMTVSTTAAIPPSSTDRRRASIPAASGLAEVLASTTAVTRSAA